jgi:hypothetical protein
MAEAILLVVAVLLVPVMIGWAVALVLVKHAPSPRARLLFWVTTALLNLLLGASILISRFIE